MSIGYTYNFGLGIHHFGAKINDDEKKELFLKDYNELYELLELPKDEKYKSKETKQHQEIIDRIKSLNDNQKSILRICIYTECEDERVLTALEKFVRVHIPYHYRGINYDKIKDVIIPSLGELDYARDFGVLKDTYGVKGNFKFRLTTGYSLYLLINKDVACFNLNGKKEDGFVYDSDFNCDNKANFTNVREEEEIYLFRHGKQKAMDCYLKLCNKRYF